MENVEISAEACLGFPLSNPDVATVLEGFVFICPNAREAGIPYCGTFFRVLSATKSA